jgi:hypothetical protein
MGRLRDRNATVVGPDVTCVAVALLFAAPNEPAIARASDRKDYFEVRTGDLWDLFFAGYYRWGRDHYDPDGEAVSSEPDGPWFSAREFNEFRRSVERQADGRWVYSGDVDLVLINAFLVPGGEPIIDWESTVGRSLTDPNGHYVGVSIAGVIEAVSRGIEQGYESPDWNLPSAAAVRQQPSTLGGFAGFARDVLSNVLAALITNPAF